MTRWFDHAESLVSMITGAGPFAVQRRLMPANVASAGAVASMLVILLLAPLAAFGQPDSTESSTRQPSQQYAPEVPRLERLIIASNRNNPPLKFCDENGQAAGLLIDVWRLWSDKTGVPVEFRTADFAESVRMVRDGEADLHAGLFFSDERDGQLDFTEPICDLAYRVIVHDRDRHTDHPTDLRGVAVGAPAAGFTESFMRREFPDADLRLYPDYPSLYDAVIKGELSVFVSPAVNLFYHCNEHDCDDLFHYVMAKPLFVRRYRGATRKERIDLIHQINTGLERITPDERAEIERRWFVDVEARYREAEEVTIDLTPRERAWIAAHPTIRASADPYHQPFAFITKNHELAGISGDYLVLIGQRVGLSIEVVPADTWNDALALARRRETDVLAGAVRTDPREAYLAFTDVFVTSPMMIFTRKGAPFVGGALDLAGKTVALQEDSHQLDRLRRDYPQLRLKLFSTTDESLQAVATARADAYVDTLAQGSYAIEQLGFTNLKVAAPLDGETAGFRMAVRKDWPELVSILNKGLRSITPDEAAAIRAKWVAVRFEHGQDVRRVLQWSAAIVGLLGIGGLTALLWARRLRREINRRLQVEARLKKAKERAESADRLKSTFLATMSHELRTPLNSIIGFTGIMLQGLTGPLNAEQQKQLGMVQGSSTHLLDLINDVLDISKIEAGQLEMLPRRFSLRQSIEKVINTVAPLASQKGLTLETEIAAQVREIKSDSKRVEQILINLLSNAVKFTDRGGVRLRAERRAGGEGSGAMIHVEVADTGIGIKDEDMDRLFETFSQIDVGLSRRRDGTGLGLSICKKLVAQLGGHIEVQSEWGVGSVFAFSLPEVWADQQSE